MNGAAQSSRSRRPADVRRAQAPLVVELLDAAALRRLDPRQWDELAASALDENPYYARPYVLASLGTIEADDGPGALAVRDAADGILVGLFPFRQKRLPLRSATAAANAYQPLGLPLIHRDRAEAVITAWLDAVEAWSTPQRWSFPNTDLTSGFARLCKQHAAQRGLRVVPTRRYQRPRLTRLEGGLQAHLETAMSKGRVKDIQRNLRRLRKLGEVRYEHAVAPAAVAQRVEDFLRIEHAGWKGSSGTSFLSDARHADFARRAFGRPAAAAGFASTDTLWLDDRPIAININVHAGDTVFTPKCAFDETYRKCSPGLVLEYLVIEAFYREARCAEMDAATTVEGHLVQSLWNADKPMATLIVGPDDWWTAALVRWHERTAKLKSGARTLLAPGPLAPALNLLRGLRRRLQSMHGDVLVTFMCATHTLEGVVKVAL